MAKVAFTAGRVEGFKCPPDKTQAFIWDLTAPGLGLRATPAGKPSYVFQGRHGGQTVRMTIGSPNAWTIPQAREKARELQRQIDEGRDPRQVKAATVAADNAKRADEKRQTVTAREAWDAYVLERTPHWGERHLEDHRVKAAPGGVKGKRGKPLRPGPLAPLLALPLRDLDAATVEAWAAREAKTRPTVARLAWRLLKAFLGWCSEQPAYAGAVPDKNPAKSKKARESLGKPRAKGNPLQREQLAAWFSAVRAIRNPVVAAYLQTLLLTGARPGEVRHMQWEGLNPEWKGLTMRDKKDGERTIPLTPYVAQLLDALPRRNKWVFSGVRASIVAAPNAMHTRACEVAGIENRTLHDIRSTFSTVSGWLGGLPNDIVKRMAEWVNVPAGIEKSHAEWVLLLDEILKSVTGAANIPAGVVAQIQGHKQSAIAEKHYIRRPLDMLRMHHERIEAWILEQAGIKFDPAAATGGLRLVTAT